MHRFAPWHAAWSTVQVVGISWHDDAEHDPYPSQTAGKQPSGESGMHSVTKEVMPTQEDTGATGAGLLGAALGIEVGDPVVGVTVVGAGVGRVESGGSTSPDPSKLSTRTEQ